MFENGTASFGRARPERPVKQDHLWRWTTFSRKISLEPKRSIYVLTEISGNFGKTESTHCCGTLFSRMFSWAGNPRNISLETTVCSMLNFGNTAYATTESSQHSSARKRGNIFCGNKRFLKNNQ